MFIMSRAQDKDMRDKNLSLRQESNMTFSLVQYNNIL